MGEVETIKMEYKVKQGPVGKGRLVKQLSQHQAFQAGLSYVNRVISRFICIPLPKCKLV